MKIICLDMEGVVTPEIWIELAARTGIDELRRTTRDEPDYDVLMQFRLEVLARHNLGFSALQKVIESLDPLPGAVNFLTSLRSRYPVVLLSDTFAQFAGPLLAKLGYPTLLCHRLDIQRSGRISGYRLRMPDHKRAAVEAFRGLNYMVCAAGDSYNDTRMLAAADAGFLFRPPQNVIDEFPEFPVFTEYMELLEVLEAADERAKSPVHRLEATA